MGLDKTTVTVIISGMEVQKYTIDELCSLTGYSRRTIRYYVQEGMLEPPAGRGRGGFYNDSHLNQLLLIKSLQQEGLSLTEIRYGLETDKTSQVEYSLKTGTVDFTTHTKDRKRQVVKYSRSAWTRYEIIPGLEINLNQEMEKRLRTRIPQIAGIIESILKEEAVDD